MSSSTINQPGAQATGSKVTPVACAPGWSGLNVGCGQRFHAEWINLDLHPTHPSVRRWDVTAPLPFEDASCDAVYHSHLLEHLPCGQALPFLRECRRVLKPGGILRVAIPNLEAMARLYLYALDDAWRGDAEALAHHRWLVMEMYDQATRESSGGAMVEYLKNEKCELASYRIGADGAVIRKGFCLPSPSGRGAGGEGEDQNPPATNVGSRVGQCPAPSPPAPLPEGEGRNAAWRERLKSWLMGSWRERLIRWLLGKDYALLQLGRFRRAGEVHHWMYDRVSLRALLTEAGFEHFRCVGPRESDIPNWCDFHLDETSEGDVCKPDSLFVEATRG